MRGARIWMADVVLTDEDEGLIFAEGEVGEGYSMDEALEDLIKKTKKYIKENK